MEITPMQPLTRCQHVQYSQQDSHQHGRHQWDETSTHIIERGCGCESGRGGFRGGGIGVGNWESDMSMCEHTLDL